ncbi:hypothetical protein NDU88_006640 [Pleurodeles waltl]|uniref:Uncharacterized protein n=1 Tax=Pleurodeles waltl TaxID=8319 RepID=A0AAV7U0P9_PLEWA|nr:hypothetical protein NDU88_006640 [Pleurodeles waltl]
MASNRVRVGKRKGGDPELAQLLKLALAKLGDGDSDGGEAPSEVEDNGEASSRPWRMHVARRVAFPPVKRRSKKQVAVAQQPPSPSPDVTVSEQAPVLAAASTTANNTAPRAECVVAAPTATLGVESKLADIQRSLVNLSAHPVGSPVQLPPKSQVLVTTVGPSTEQVQVAPASPVTSQDPMAQALLAVSQLLTNINTASAHPRPTTPWANDSLQNSVLELKRQVEALAAARNVPPLHVTTASPCVTLAPGSLTQATPLEKEQGKITEQGNIPAKNISSAEGAGMDTLLSRPGKLAAHVAPDIKGQIWKGEFVDIFSLIRAKRREVETKEKDAKASSSIKAKGWGEYY